MSANTAASKQDEEEKDSLHANNPLLAMIIVDVDEIVTRNQAAVDGDVGQCGTTIKLRLRQGDVPNGGREITASDLLRYIGQQLATVYNQARQQASSSYQVEVYDRQQNAFRSLQDYDAELDIIRCLGRRIRSRVERVIPTAVAGATANVTGSDPQEEETQNRKPMLAIQGRYFPYDGTVAIRNQLVDASYLIQIQEATNQPQQETAGNVWDGAILLAKVMECQSSDWIANKNVLELGSGTGLVGIVAGVLGARQVILSDLPHATPLIQINVDGHESMWKQAGCQSMHCIAYDWFTAVPPALVAEQKGTIDVILVADCVWMLELVTPLLQTLRVLTDQSPSADVLVSYQRRGKPTHDAFLQGMGQMFERMEAVDLPAIGIDDPEPLFVYRCRRNLLMES